MYRSLARPSDRAEIVRRVREVRSDNAGRWGRMTAHQMVCHLSDALLMAIGEKVVEPRSGLVQRTLLKWTVLYLPLRWPAGIPTCPELDQQLGGTRPANFTADVARLLALLERVGRNSQRAHQRMHPIFGRMSAAAWLRWGYLHADHHLRQFGV